jgi:hypothetical protein
MIEAANLNGLGIKSTAVQDLLNSVPLKVTISLVLVILKK